MESSFGTAVLMAEVLFKTSTACLRKAWFYIYLLLRKWRNNILSNLRTFFGALLTNTELQTIYEVINKKEMREEAHKDQVSAYLGSLGDLLPLDIFGDFFPTQSSLSSMSLESEQLQLSIMADIRLLPYISSKEGGKIRRQKCAF